MKKITMIIALLGFLTTMATGQERKMILDGKIESDTLINGIIYLRYKDQGTEMLDSVVLKNNTYHFENTISEGAVAAYVVWYDKNIFNPDDVFTGMRGMLYLQLEASSISVIHTDTKEFEKATITGSGAQDEYNYVSELFRAGKLSQLEVALDFTKKYPNSWYNLHLLGVLAADTTISLDKVDSLYDNLGAELRGYPQAQSVKKVIAGKRNTATGKPAVNFTLNDTNGNPVSLSSFRGKYVLLDFWASWCIPCREENPNVLKAYKRFQPNGFTVLGVSLDDEKARDAWLKAVKEDKLPWKQVVDPDGTVRRMYGIQSVPASFLIDPDGVIIAKNLKGEYLHKKLREIFKN